MAGRVADTPSGATCRVTGSVRGAGARPPKYGGSANATRSAGVMREDNDLAAVGAGSSPSPADEDHAAKVAQEPPVFVGRDLIEALRRRLPEGAGHTLGTAASLALFCLAAFILIRSLANLRISHLGAALAATSAKQLFEALIFTALSYLWLTGYDFSALRQIKARAPYRVIALGSFASYAFSFNLGFPLVTAAATRFWVYSRANITAAQVVNITVIAGVTFWLGMIAMIGAGLMAGANELSSIDNLPVFVNFALGTMVLAAIVYYSVYVSLEKRRIRLRGHFFELPGLASTLTQIALGAADLCCAAAALYVLLPQGAGLDFMAFVAIYVFACLLGVASNAPGGIGVFEATILHAIPAPSQENLFAALLLFRLIYYLIPFVLALAVLGSDEGSRRWSGLREAIANIIEDREV